MKISSESIICPYCNQIHSIHDYVFIEDNEINARFHIQCCKCNKYVSVVYTRTNIVVVETCKSMEYVELKEDVEDYDGVNKYVIISSKQISKKLMEELEEHKYIGISRFEYLCNLYKVEFEEYREGE